MHHYNFPPFSVGEARPIRSPGRRNRARSTRGTGAGTGHPFEKEFPLYDTSRVRSSRVERFHVPRRVYVLPTLALMHAGVPIKAPVAGIAMGLIKEGEKVGSVDGHTRNGRPLGRYGL